ncbi:hypothetical protein GALMADRAFT_136289 [Galerina marginata CBS 339.88]|uniref:Uncharacterized protein n=1 Tax=Galerina marginata (strain CBS 339.88) TaxID=685588 RepID=A0A067TDG5_GALM3|nr:hypothetical protein GALMADRAFT_136289 [Galerina marginata CBS 339.88]
MDIVERYDVAQAVAGENGVRNAKLESGKPAYVDFDVRTTNADDDEEDYPNEWRAGNWFRKTSPQIQARHGPAVPAVRTRLLLLLLFACERRLQPPYPQSASRMPIPSLASYFSNNALMFEGL